jgi:hypothetical protein
MKSFETPIFRRGYIHGFIEALRIMHYRSWSFPPWTPSSARKRALKEFKHQLSNSRLPLAERRKRGMISGRSLEKWLKSQTVKERKVA